MNNLLITVSFDSSIDLLKQHADVIILDQNPNLTITRAYNTVYIRSHFSQPTTLPQNFRSEISKLARDVKNLNPEVTFIDHMDNVDAIVNFEDKWNQYSIFSKFMPLTKKYDSDSVTSHFVHPVYKKRLSSRGSGVTWDLDKVKNSVDSWIIQESLDITEEIRSYVIFDEVYPVCAVKQYMTEGQKSQATSSRVLTRDEVDFSFSLMQETPDLEVVGIDVARTSEGRLNLMEVNRSPGFAKFYELTGSNLADEIYSK